MGGDEDALDTSRYRLSCSATNGERLRSATWRAAKPHTRVMPS
jgi:hypothetical protein